MKSQLIHIKLLALTMIIGLLAVSCGNKESKPVGNDAQIQAQTSVAKLMDFPVVHSFSGKLEADKQSNLSTRIMGQISRIYVKPGQKVKTGDLLLQIRNQDILAKKAQVEANKVEASSAFENAEKDLKRFEALYKSESASDKEMDDIRTQYNMAKARLEAVNQMENEVNENMRYASIRAPYSGVITSKFVQDGDLANPGMPLLSMESPGQWKVIARIPEADIARINLNDSVNVEFNAVNAKLSGQVVEINPSATNTGNQYEAKILVSIPEGCTAKLYSGMYATVLFEHGLQKLILVPKKSLVHRGQLVGLYAVSQSGNALLRWVKTGKNYGDDVEILSGLSDGERYVESADSKLFDGALIAN